MFLHFKNKAFTMVELLTTIAIIAILIGRLIPSLTAVRRVAMKTNQNAQFAALDQALMAFKNEMGYYPPSQWPTGSDYCGAQKLAEALVGWDLLGFHPDSDFRAKGARADGDGGVYDALDNINLDQRVGPYLDVSTANVFRLGSIPDEDKSGLFDDTSVLEADTFVICDSFPVKKIITPSGEVKKAGTPILYYKANVANKEMLSRIFLDLNIYNSRDNRLLIFLGQLSDTTKGHALDATMFYSVDKYKIIDRDIYEATGGDLTGGRRWPHRADSYILISAGPDGEYGTEDDMTNFGK